MSIMDLLLAKYGETGTERIITLATVFMQIGVDGTEQDAVQRAVSEYENILFMAVAAYN